MINFRYHVVSITAVFLALAIGLVVGTAAFNGPVADRLEGSVETLRKDNKQLRESVGQLQDEVNRQEDFATQAAPMLLSGRLTNRRIVLVTLPTGQEYAEQVLAMLVTAGATVTGRVDVEENFTNPENSVELLDLADRAARPTLPATGLPANGDGIETSSALLANALLDRSPPVANPDRRGVLEAYAAAGYLNVPEQIAGPAEAVLLVTGLPPVDSASDAKNQAMVTVIAQFDKAGQLVVGGNGVGDGNVISAVRGDPTLAKTIATVDNAHTSMGAVVTALALAEVLAAGRVGHYGLLAGATSILPTPPQ